LKKLYVPADAEEGTYFVTLYADGSHTIRVNVGYPENTIKVHSPITGVAAEAGDTVKFQITIENLLTGDYPIELGCTAPNGWRCRYIENDEVDISYPQALSTISRGTFIISPIILNSILQFKNYWKRSVMVERIKSKTRTPTAISAMPAMRCT